MHIIQPIKYNILSFAEKHTEEKAKSCNDPKKAEEYKHLNVKIKKINRVFQQMHIVF